MADININEVIVNPSAERIVLSNCMNDTNMLIECESEGLTPRHFAIEANKIIYNAIIYLFTKHQKIDALSIINIVKDEKAKQEIERIGGLEYLLLLQQSPKTYNINMFIKEILNNYTKRQIYNICKDVQDKTLTNTESDMLIGELNQKVADITLEQSKSTESYKMGDGLLERLQRASECPTEVPGLSVGWAKFDKITRGAIAGDLIITCAESKTGKSVTMLNWAKHIAIDQQLPILWIDSEQTAEEEEYRLVSNMSQVPEDELKTGLFTQDTAYGTAQEKTQRINIAKHLLSNSNFHHIFMPEFTLEKIVAITRKFHLKYGIVALFFDYVKLNPSLIQQYRGMRDDVILTIFTTGLKNIGGTIKIPVFTAAQENRTGYGSTEKDAKNIGGSIGILQIATKLLFLRNKTEEELAVEGAKRGNQKLLIKYQRHGQSGDVELDIMYDKPKLTQYEV